MPFASEQIVACIATLVLAVAFAVRTVRVARLGAIAASAIVLAFAVTVGAFWIAAAQLVLIGVNIYRLWRLRQLHAQVRLAREDAVDASDFQDYFVREKHKRGDTLFLKGNPGNYAYFVAAGEITFPEVAAQVGAGEFFGEFSLFTDGGLRTATAVCRTDVDLYRIDADTLAATFHRKPDFAFALVRLIVRRMNRNNERLNEQNAKLRVDQQLVRQRVI